MSDDRVDRDVVVTGIGAVGAFGLGREALGAALASGAPLPATVLDRSAGYHRAGGARRALLLAGHDLAPLLPPAVARRSTGSAKMAIAATRLALIDAGLASASKEELADIAVVSGIAFGPPWVTEQLLQQIFRTGPESASPALFTESVASAAASQVALATGAKGPTSTLTCREASDLAGLAAGAELVRTGRAARALVIVAEEQIPLLHAALDRFGALARPEADGTERARPFDRARSGFLAAEGAAVVLLEPRAAAAARAVQRGRSASVRIVASGSGFDPTASSWQFGSDAESIARRLRRALDRRGVALESIELVVAGASGSRTGDRLLGRALRTLFAEAMPPIAAPKGLVGEYGGGFLAAALLLAGGAAAAVAGFEEVDPELGIALRAVPNRVAPGRTLLLTAAVGGGWAWTLVDTAGEPSIPAGV